MRSPLSQLRISFDEDLIRGNSAKLLDFEQFLRTFELIAERIYPEFDQEAAISHIIEVNLKKAMTISEQATDSVVKGCDDV